MPTRGFDGVTEADSENPKPECKIEHPATQCHQSPLSHEPSMQRFPSSHFCV